MTDQEIQNFESQRCFHHANRQAVVRCPVCRHHYCRECVTEHDDRMLCTNCLKKQIQSGAKKQQGWRASFRFLLQGTIGFTVIWYGFFLLGKLLLAIPSSFHEGTFLDTLRGLLS